jgi:hypothetical protein
MNIYIGDNRKVKMARRKKKRKTRVTKKDIEVQRKELKLTSAQRKKKIIPGPWTNMEHKHEVSAKMKMNKTIMSDILGPAYGNYTKDELWGEKGWYAIVFNVASNNMKGFIKKHGMDEFLAATEKSLNSQKDKSGKPLYGTLIITKMCVDNSQREDKSRRFISLRGKTNKKSIKGFRAIRKKEYVTL